jgi:hypothetical protein
VDTDLMTLVGAPCDVEQAEQIVADISAAGVAA